MSRLGDLVIERGPYDQDYLVGAGFSAPLGWVRAPELNALRDELVERRAAAVHERARQGRFPLWMHACGHAEAFPAEWEPQDGGCDACESGSDEPADWRPLYVQERPAMATGS